MLLDLLPLVRAGAKRLQEQPEVTAWLAGWLAASLGLRVHATLAPPEGDVETAVLAALGPI